MKTNDPVLKAISCGHLAILITGNYHDLCVHHNKIYYKPIYIAEMLSLQEHVVLFYTFSTGLYIHNYNEFQKEKKDKVDQVMKSSGLDRLLKKTNEVNAEELNQIIRGMDRLLKMTHEIKFVCCFGYTEHVVPNSQSVASEPGESLFVVEMLHSLIYSSALRKSGNRILCFSRDGLFNPLLNDMYRVEYEFPMIDELKEFTQVLIKRKEPKE